MRLPRTRGDGPAPTHGRSSHPARGAPPHTRGWTRIDVGRTGSTPAAPPHTRGWTVDVIMICVWDEGSPAHAGWTLEVVPIDVGVRGSPAHAGMDPRSYKRLRSGYDDGSPAHAGMDPSPLMGCLAQAGRTGLPRTRGDGPQSRTLPVILRSAPPHTRGWTHQADRRGRDRTGSPAHAGMDPVTRRGSRPRPGQ